MKKRGRKRSDKAPTPLFNDYQSLPGCYDEFFDGEEPRPETAQPIQVLKGLSAQNYRSQQSLANLAFRKGGVTFSVYSNQKGVEKIFPFDLIPRVVSGEAWDPIEVGLKQRIRALNAFLNDVYGDQRILKEKKIPRDFVEGSKAFIKSMIGVKPVGGVYIHIGGIDLIRDETGGFLVLEDNIRTPSGVSYVLENRQVMKRIFPKLFKNVRVRSVSAYPLRLRDALVSLSPRSHSETTLVILTPGPYNSAYFEHSYLARLMGCTLVQGRDLLVQDDRVYMKTTSGLVQVDVIYRRVDDEFIDPEEFRADSLLGVPGLIDVYKKGRVVLANAIGNGVADDKALYPFVPDMIRFYLSEEPVLNQVETFICARKKDRDYVLKNLDKLVVKAVNASGGYGMLFGPAASKAEIEDFRELLLENPRSYIAQHVVELSVCPTWTGSEVAPRRVDLRPFIVTGRSSWVLPGGLTRVALNDGSYIVNSSQGGGSKETWVLEKKSGW